MNNVQTDQLPAGPPRPAPAVPQGLATHREGHPRLLHGASEPGEEALVTTRDIHVDSSMQLRGFGHARPFRPAPAQTAAY